eukprot:759246-Hanusia_phi.AAC.1
MAPPAARPRWLRQNQARLREISSKTRCNVLSGRQRMLRSREIEMKREGKGRDEGDGEEDEQEGENRCESACWYLKIRSKHALASLCFTWFAIMLELRQRGMQQERAVQDMTPTRSFLAILVISLSFLGVPHGATDHLVGDKIFKHSFPNTWLCVFVVVYLAMMGMVIASWFLAPVASLAAFLFLSVIHWGLGDTESDLVPLTLQPLEGFHSHLASKRFASGGRLANFLLLGLVEAETLFQLMKHSGWDARRYQQRAIDCQWNVCQHVFLHVIV